MISPISLYDLWHPHVGVAPVWVLKLMLGVILVISALRIFSKKPGHPSSVMPDR